jgi:thiol-disulfide isomerase/thioredoxin
MSAGPNRRAWLLGGAGLAAATLGIGGALWLERRSAGTPAAAAAWWRQPFATPDGGTLEPASLLGRPLLLNFWATWCPPCVREMPLLDRFHRLQEAARPGRGVRVLGLAIDGPTPVREFLQRSPIGYPVILGGLDGMRLVRELGNATGALPFSVLFDADGVAMRTHVGELDEARLRDWAR